MSKGHTVILVKEQILFSATQFDAIFVSWPTVEKSKVPIKHGRQKKTTLQGPRTCLESISIHLLDTKNARAEYAINQDKAPEIYSLRTTK